MGTQERFFFFGNTDIDAIESNDKMTENELEEVVKVESR
jgi:hypothetical protein